MEYDLVDFDDNFIQTGTKDDAKRLGLFTRSVHIWLLNKKGELMISKRSPNKKNYPNQFTSSAGGHVDKGESYSIAAERELKEELGVVTSLTDLGRFDVITLNERAIHHLFIGIVNDTNFIIDQNEISEYSFLSIESLKDNIKANSKKYCSPFLEAFRYYLKCLDLR